MYVSQGFYNDLRSARKAQSEDAKKVTLHRLTKAGKRNQMAGSTVKFNTVEQAQDYISNLKNLNPGKVFNFEIEVQAA